MGRLPAEGLHSLAQLTKGNLANDEFAELIWCKNLMFKATFSHVFIFACTRVPVNRLSYQALVPMCCPLRVTIYRQSPPARREDPLSPASALLRAQLCSQYMETGWVRISF